MLIEDFTFVYAFIEWDDEKSLQEPKHLSGSKNMSGIFSKRIVSCENKKKKKKNNRRNTVLGEVNIGI